MTRRPRVAIVSLGCRSNRYDAAAIAAGFPAELVEVSAERRAADVFVVNTCTVTGKAEREARQTILALGREFPGVPIIVTGCLPTVDANGLAGLPGVNAVFSNPRKMEIASHVLGLCHIGAEAAGAPGAAGAAGYPEFLGRSRPNLRVQDGCDANCTYCIIPKARGRSRSRLPAEIAGEVDTLAGRGAREIVLTGIHLGAYGKDLSPPRTLADLVQYLLAHSSEPARYRLSSVEPLEISQALLDLLRPSGRVCRHLHVPLQHADGQILGLMGRPYSARQFGELLDRLHRQVPEICAGLDIMVGFPGETDARFETLRRFLEDHPWAYLHVFAYSPRPGTKAAEMPGRARREQARERSARLRALSGERRQRFHEAHLGRQAEIILESSFLRGLTDNFIPVSVPRIAGARVGSLLTVVLRDADPRGMRGEYL